MKAGSGKLKKSGKMALAKQLKQMTIGGGDKKAGIHNRKMSSSSESEGDEMEVDEVGGAGNKNVTE